MRITLVSLAILAVLLPVPRTASAQPPTPMPGTLVRVMAPTVSPVPLTGVIVDSNDRELVVFQPASGKKAIPIDAITRLHWSEGRHNKAASFAKWGAIGMGGVMAVTFAANASPGGDFFCRTRGGCFVFGAATGALGGAMYGAVAGVLIRTYDWKEVPVQKLRADPTPQFTIKVRF